jgi:hypothetical protein
VDNPARRKWWGTSIAIGSDHRRPTVYGIIGLFPNLLPANINAQYSLTCFNATSGPLTLKIMLMVIFRFMPLVLACHIRVYHQLKGKVVQNNAALDEVCSSCPMAAEKRWPKSLNFWSVLNKRCAGNTQEEHFNGQAKDRPSALGDNLFKRFERAGSGKNRSPADKTGWRDPGIGQLSP